MTNIVYYVCRDIERALGKDPCPDYQIITNKNNYSDKIKSDFPDFVHLISDSKILDTYELLSRNEATDLIKKNDGNVLVFKNTSLIEKLCNENHIRLLNPPSSLAEKIENKITQKEWLGDLSSMLPENEILTLSQIKFDKVGFILQFAHSHTGDGTIFIANEKDLSELSIKFPERLVKKTEFINGPILTLNINISEKIHLGNISYQITGMLPFTENPWSTVGNDWSLPHSILTEEKISEINEMAMQIGQKMLDSKWKGIFGIDVVYDESRDQIFLIEINARQTASSSYESQLEKKFGFTDTIFDAHLLSVQNISVDFDLPLINDGSQIVQRVTKSKISYNENELKNLDFNLIHYENSKSNEDLIRFQNIMGIMETHNKFNKRGKSIIENIL